MRNALRLGLVAALSLTAGMAAAFGPLTTADALDEADTVLDIRAASAFTRGHIPGSVNAPYGAFRGGPKNPGEMMTEDRLEAVLEGVGIEAGDKIAILHEGANASDFGAAARVYWTLKSAGFHDLAIVNGGYNSWAAAGHMAHAGPVSVAPSELDIALDDSWTMGTEEVAKVVTGQSEALLIDARPADFFKAKRKHGAAKEAGTIEGAISLVNFAWFKDDKAAEITPPESLIEQVKALAAENEGKPLVSFCNTGHWAATNWFAVSELAGVENVKLYPESMVGWTLKGNKVVVGQ